MMQTTITVPVLDGALCAQIDPELWFPEISSKLTTLPARAICAQCPVIRECAAWAIPEGDELYGVWGGLTREDRRAIRAARKEGTGMRTELIVTWPIVDPTLSTLDLATEALEAMSDEIAARGVRRLSATKFRVDWDARSVTAWCHVAVDEGQVEA